MMGESEANGGRAQELASEAASALNDAVAAQYQRWIYPKPLQDMDVVQAAARNSKFQHLRTAYSMYWPAAPYRDDLNILIAGCGTVEAAWYAHLYPRARVVGIDVSAASLASAEQLKQRHRLANLTLHRLPVEHVQALGDRFDFIMAAGVLHHLADPPGGLRALAGILEPNGIIDIMVYGKYGRIGVYMLQDLFRHLQLGQTPQAIQTVKEALSELGSEHPVRPYLRSAPDLAFDSGLVDTFLHARDRAYAVKDCLDLASKAGVVFQVWDDNGMYYPDGHEFKNYEFRRKIEALQGAEVWQAMELLQGNITKHRFHVCRAERAPNSYRITFDGDEFLNYAPALRGDAFVSDGYGAGKINIGRPNRPTVHLDELQTAVFRQINGERSVRQCLESADVASRQKPNTEFARNFFGSFWRAGYMMFRFEEEKRPPLVPK